MRFSLTLAPFITLLGVIGLLAVPAGASAFQNALLANGALSLQGEGNGETFVVFDLDAATVAIKGKAPISDPDGAGPCKVVGDVLQCPDAGVSLVQINAGDGDDTVLWERDTNADPTDLGMVHGGKGSDTLTVTGLAPGIKKLYGEDGDDVLTEGVNTALDGGADVDDLWSNASGGGLDLDDLGGLGNDRFHGTPGFPDHFSFDDGNDLYLADTGEQDSLSYAGISSAVNVSLDGVANDGRIGETDSAASSLQSITGGTGDDILDGSSVSHAVNLRGGAGSDKLYGGSGDDLLVPGLGADVVKGNGGNDAIDTSGENWLAGDPVSQRPGADQLDGGPGDDKISLTWKRDGQNGQADGMGGDDLVGGPGNDILYLAATGVPGLQVSLDDAINDGVRDASPTTNAHSDFERVYLAQGDNILTGGSSNEQLQAGSGNDAIDGGGGQDVIDAGDGADLVTTRDGAHDQVDCGPGSDLTVVGDALDTLINCEGGLDTGVIGGGNGGADGGGAGGSGTGPTTPVNPPDRRKPRLRLTSFRYSMKTLRKQKAITLKLTTSEAARLAAQLTAKGLTQAKVSTVTKRSGIPLKPGAAVVKLKISTGVLNRLAKLTRKKTYRRTGVPATLTLTARDPAGNTTIVTATLHIKA